VTFSPSDVPPAEANRTPAARTRPGLAEGAVQADLARSYGVSQATISRLGGA